MWSPTFASYDESNKFIHKVTSLSFPNVTIGEWSSTQFAFSPNCDILDNSYPLHSEVQADRKTRTEYDQLSLLNDDGVEETCSLDRLL